MREQSLRGGWAIKLRSLLASFRPFIVLCLVISPSTHAYLLDVELDTSALSGVAGDVTWDLIAGDGGVSNEATISDFSTDASLGGVTAMGSTSGTLNTSLVLDNTSFFNSYAQSLTFADELSFSLEISENDSTGGLFPDRFSMFLLDGPSSSLVSTSDPTGANELFGIDFTGDISSLDTYSATSEPFVTWSVSPAVSEVPAPPSLILVLTGLIAFFMARTGQFFRRTPPRRRQAKPRPRA